MKDTAHVLRIIAGEKRGTNIITPKGMDTRPTLDRVRESLFGILQFRFHNARVLDLFAGSGALGLEAVSRGAAEAVFADISKDALKAIESNIKKLGFESRCTVYPVDFSLAIKKAAAAGKRFDILFLDPPYKAGILERAMEEIVAAGILSDDAVIAAEHGTDRPPADVRGLVLEDRRRYGKASVSFYRKAEQ